MTSGRESDEVSVGQLVVLELAVLDVLANPVPEVLTLLQLLVRLGGHGCLKTKIIFKHRLFPSFVFSSEYG